MKRVHSKCLSQDYYCHAYTAAWLWDWFRWTSVLAITLIIVFKSGGMWKKTNSYTEQPAVEFQSNCYVIFTQDNGDIFDYYFWSPFSELNEVQRDRLITPIVSVNENDVDGDGSVDNIVLEIRFSHPNSTFEVRSLSWMLFYKMSLNKRAIIQADGVLFHELRRPFALASYSLQSDLIFDQRKPLPSYGNYRFKQDIFSKFSDNPDQNETDVEFNYGSVSYQPFEIQRQSILANYSIKMGRKVDFWEAKGSEIPEELKLTFEFNVLPSNLVYETDAAELLKWLWIQVLAVFLVINYVFHRLTGIFIENGTFGTIPRSEKMIKLD
ncbi:unnamed protein product [Bursaphelenchus xylophilus]|uniref:Transmembrane protein 231 n=1 Tax=Bursaphelenchus xylophilus TaxID=6326 RepID=A0A1I7RJ22_BURXY|nr:unnamed protein product [Bursaphelenchus xylophilus]CAG9119273.1 unnamed protein product [Bursaphelenchus xylophilus]